jgi:molybdate transport system substrate-binding protein
MSSGIPARTDAQPITVLGASSLQAALTTAGREYGTYHPGSSVTLGFDASSALRAKIEQGAEADLFASADVENAQKLIEDGFAIGPAQRFTSNGLAIVVPADNPAHIRTPADLAKQGVRLLAAADGVPITAYAERLIGALAGEAGYPPDYVRRVAANVASREDNVAAVLAKVALGEGDAGIVYRTDALASSSVQEIPLPAGVDVPVTYAAVVLKASRQPDAARAFLAWLSGPAGQAILARYGFSPPP